MGWLQLITSRTIIVFVVQVAIWYLVMGPAKSEAAEEVVSLNQPFKFSAFGTAGLLYDDSPFHMQREFGQPDTFRGSKYSLLADSLVGAQVDYNITGRFDATVQMVAKKRAQQTIEESLEWAFIRWRPTDELAVRAGRLGLDLYMLSDYRSVGFAYLWQRPVVEFYGPLMFQNFDGADVAYSYKLGEGTLQGKLFGGVADRSLELVQGGGINNLEMSSIFGGKVSYEDEQLRLSLGYGRATIGGNLKNISELMTPLRNSSPLWPEAGTIANTIASKNRVIQFFSAGAAYEINNWLLQGEAGYLASNWPVLPDIMSGYLSVGYHINDFTPYVVLAAAKSQNGAPSVSSHPAVTGDSITDGQLAELYTNAVTLSHGIKVDQKTVSLGLRWDIYQNVALKFQWDLSMVAANGANLWWGPLGTTGSDTNYVNLLSTSVNITY